MWFQPLAVSYSALAAGGNETTTPRYCSHDEGNNGSRSVKPSWTSRPSSSTLSLWFSFGPLSGGCWSQDAAHPREEDTEAV